MNERFMQILHERGMTRYQLSKKTGIPQSTLHDWIVQGKEPSAARLTLVADALGVTMDYLIGRDEEGIKNAPIVYNNERDQKVIDAFKKLSPELQAATYRYILSLAHIQDNEEIL